jgi:hypothetical protein
VFLLFAIWIESHVPEYLRHARDFNSAEHHMMTEFPPALVTLALSGFTLLMGCGFDVKEYRLGPDVVVYDREQEVRLTSIFAKVEGMMGPTSIRMVTPEHPDKINLQFVEDLANTGGPERYEKGRFAELATAYRAHGKPPVEGTAWVVSVRPLVLAHSPSLRTLPKHGGSEVMHWSNLLYPLVTEVRLDLPITHVVVLDERAWKIAGNYDLDDDQKVADVPRRVIELSPPLTLREVLESPPWLSDSSDRPATTPTTSPTGAR